MAGCRPGTPAAEHRGWGWPGPAARDSAVGTGLRDRTARYPRAMAGGTLRVAQLNVGSLLEPDWDARREAIVAWIEHLVPDVVCLQEVWEGADGANTAGW